MIEMALQFILCLQLLNVSVHLVFHVIDAHVATQNLAIHVSHIPFCTYCTHMLTDKSKLYSRMRRTLEFKTTTHTATRYVTLERSSYVKNIFSSMGRCPQLYIMPYSRCTQQSSIPAHSQRGWCPSGCTRTSASGRIDNTCASQEMLTVARGCPNPSLHFEEPRGEMQCHSGARLSYVICNLKLNRYS